MTFPKSFQVGGSLPIPLVISNKTAAYTVRATDAETIINCTSGVFTVSLTAAAALGAGFNCTIWNTSTTTADYITIDPAGAETIDGQATLILRCGEGMRIVCNGTNWETGNKKAMRGYVENFSSNVTRAIASGNFSMALGRQSTASGVGSFAYNYGSVASNDYTIAFGASTTASAAYAIAIGGNGFTTGAQATGSGAVSLSASYASGGDSFAAAAGNNSSSYGATGANAVALGHSATASGAMSAAIGGSGSLASATRSTVLGGIDNQATSTYTYAFGFRALAAYVGKYAYGVFTTGSAGTSQGGYMVLAISTTDATATKLGSDGGAGGATNQVILANNQAMVVTGSILCRQSVAGSDKASGWTFTAVIRRGANAASTALVAAVTPTLVAQDVSLAATVVAVTADTTNGGLSITVTGIAATNLRWVATIQSTEAVYA